MCFCKPNMSRKKITANHAAAISQKHWCEAATEKLVCLRKHRAQVHIRGYGAVHIGGAEFEARKRRKVDLISFDMVIKIKVIKFKCTTEHSNISSYCYPFHTSKFGSEVHEHFNNIWQHYVDRQICSLLDEKIRYSNISHRLTCIIAFINVDYIRHSRFWMNFALNKCQILRF